MENKLKPCPHITDLSLLKITRVRPWSICFDYNGKDYLIHGSYECGEGSWQELYSRELDVNGKYNLTHIKDCAFADDNVSDDYIVKQRGKTIVYRNVYKKFFAYKLTKRGFATGIMEKDVKIAEKHVAKLLKRIADYEEKISQLRRTISNIR